MTTKGHRLPVPELARLFRLLGDETRLRLLLLLNERRERNVSELAHALGRSQPAVSAHLRLLRQAGLVEPRRNGQDVIYRRAFRESWERFCDDLPASACPVLS